MLTLSVGIEQCPSVLADSQLRQIDLNNKFLTTQCEQCQTVHPPIYMTSNVAP